MSPTATKPSGSNPGLFTGATPSPSTTAPPTSDTLPPPAPNTGIHLPVTPTNVFGKYSVRPLDYLRALIAGPTASGKSEIIKTLPRPCVVLYAERSGGDCELRRLEKEGIILIYLDRQNPLRDVDEVLDNILTGPAKDMGIQSIAMDSISHFADWTLANVNTNNRTQNSYKVAGGATQRNYGLLTAAIKPVLIKLLGMPQHVLLTSHLKREEEVFDDWEDGQKIQHKRTICWPKLSPAVADLIIPEVALLGYSWRKEVLDNRGQPVLDEAGKTKDKFGVSFKARSFNRERELFMLDAKSPGDWGMNEEPNVTSWIQRLEIEKGMSMLRAAA